MSLWHYNARIDLSLRVELDLYQGEIPYDCNITYYYGNIYAVTSLNKLSYDWRPRTDPKKGTSLVVWS